MTNCSQPAAPALYHHCEIQDDPSPVRASISVAALAEMPLICLPPGTGVRTCLERACAVAGIQARVAFEASDPRMVVRFAERGLGVALVPESVALAHAATLRTMAVTGAPMRSGLGLAWRSDVPANPAARALIAQARRTLPNARSGQGRHAGQTQRAGR